MSCWANSRPSATSPSASSRRRLLRSGEFARQAAPIATAIPVPQAQLIGEAAELVGNMLADAIDAVADEWRIGLDDSRR